MDNNSLTNFYDNLKTQLNSDKGNSSPSMPVATMGSPVAQMPIPAMMHHKMMKHCDKLKDDCRKHILLDMYVKILPVDDDFKCGHMGMMKNDIDCMLKNKGMTATQYMTSCSEATHAPLLEYLMRATDIIGSQYLREAEAEAEDAAKNGAANVEPKEPSVNDAEVQDQLVDIKKDSEYETFIDKLKEKTINKIVKDVSDLISDKKEEKKMTFDPKDSATPNAAVNPNPEEAVAESAVSVGLDYIQKQIVKHNIQLSESAKDDILALAIREATLNQFDVVFNQKSGQFNEFASRIRWGKGVLINESAVNEYFNESTDHDEDDVESAYNEYKIIADKLDKRTDEEAKKKLFKLKSNIRIEILHKLSKELPKKEWDKISDKNFGMHVEKYIKSRKK